nr:RNA-binding protein [Cytophagales bacterium]
QASEKEPVCVYAKDYDQNGTTDPVLCRYIQGKEYITHYRESLTDQIVGLKKTLTSYKTYGEKTFRDVFTEELLKDALILRATYFSSAYIENKGNGRFNIRPLPAQAQLAPVFGMMASDVNQDGNLDLLSVGNDFSAEPLTGRYDASVGTCLLGNGKGGFVPVPLSRSGFLVRGDAKAFAEVRLANGKSLLLVTQNQDKLLSFIENSSQNASLYPVRPNDAYAKIILANSKTHKQEFYYGDTYLSQSSRVLKIPKGAKEVRIFNTKGQVRNVRVPTFVAQQSKKQ